MTQFLTELPITGEQTCWLVKKETMVCNFALGLHLREREANWVLYLAPRGFGVFKDPHQTSIWTCAMT